MQLQTEVKSNPKQPSCKKSCGPKKAIVKKKKWNPRWQPRNGCDGRLMTKFLITTIQVNLVPNPSETWEGNANSHELSLLKILPLACHFLAATLNFTSFFTIAFWGHTFFLHLGCSGLDFFNGTECLKTAFKHKHLAQCYVYIPLKLKSLLSWWI